MISMAVLVMAETPPAIMVRRLDRPAHSGAWLPKELIDIEREGEDGTATLWITKELATTRGLM